MKELLTKRKDLPVFIAGAAMIQNKHYVASKDRNLNGVVIVEFALARYK